MVSSIGVKVLLLAALVAVPFITSSYTAYQLGLYILFGIVGPVSYTHLTLPTTP